MITPWNFPIAIPAWKIAPALAYGNTVVFKPADLVPGCARALAEIIVRAGAAQGRLQSRHGPRFGGRPGDARPSATIDAISFTGSVATGQRVAQACAGAMRKVQLEMGGKNPLVVLDDADLKTRGRVRDQRRLLLDRPALHRVLAPDRHRGHLRRFADGAGRAHEALVVDDALKAGIQIGPVVDQSQLDQDLEYVEIGQDEGAQARLRRRAA